MPVPTNVNIKQLNQIEEIVNGNFLIVETDKGTQILDFANFVAGPENVSFYNDFASLCSQVVALSSYLDTTVTSLSTTVDATVKTQIASLCATIDQKYDQVFYQSGVFTLPSYTLTSDAVAIIVPAGVTLTTADVNIAFNSTVTPTSTGAAINAYPVLNGSSPYYTLQAILTNPSFSVVTIGYNIFKSY